MQLSDIVAPAINGLAARLGRLILAYAACVVFALMVIFEVKSAAVLALAPHVGVVIAHLAVAVVFAFAIVAVIVALHMARRPKRAAQSLKEAPATQETGISPRTIAMAYEVFLLGYSMAQRSSSDRKAHRA